MKMPGFGTLAFGGVAGAALLLAVLGAPHDRPPPAPVATSVATPASVSAGGFTLASTAVDLPDDDSRYPSGAHADVINANCTSCHSASMALTQPRLTVDQWKAEVTKMREVFHAPVSDAAVPDIVSYLSAMPGQQDGATTKPAPKPDAAGGTG